MYYDELIFEGEVLVLVEAARVVDPDSPGLLDMIMTAGTGY